MKKLLLITLVCLILCTMFPATAELAFSQDDIIAAALTELTVDGSLSGDVLTDPICYRTMIVYHANPDEESIRGESWYIRFDAVDRINHDSYIVALNEDASLRYLDVALCDTAMAQCPTIDFAGLLDQYRDAYGPCDSWPSYVWIAFSADMSKGKPNGRNAWRIQHAVFLPEPEQSIGQHEAKRLAVLACGDEKLTAWNCVCLLDGDKAIYRLGVSEGEGWQYMVEIDCITGDTISVTPYDPSVNSWLDCYIPQSVVNAIPAADTFKNTGMQNPYVAASASANIRRGINPHTFEGTDKGIDNEYFALAGDDALPADTAYNLALRALSDHYGIETEALQSYEVSFGYSYAPSDFDGDHYWQFDFENPNDPLDSYEIILDAQGGNVRYTCGPDEGNG